MMIATCARCEQPMDGRSCVETKAWPWGDEPLEAGEPRAISPCRDCGVRIGGQHHEGCAVAHCRVCGEQLLGCECRGLVN